jgi:hypothetical protein
LSDLQVQNLDELDDAEQAGHWSTRKTDENVDSMKKSVLQNRSVTVHEVSNILESSVGLIHDILKGSVNMSELTTKFMRHACTLCFVFG